MSTVAELLEREKIQFTIPRPKEKIKKRRPPVVVRYILIKSDKKPTSYFVHKADKELKRVISDMLVGITDMVMGDKNVHTVESATGIGFDTFVYRGIYTTNNLGYGAR